MPAGRTELGRTVCYDNIAVGAAISSKERTIAGALPPAKLSGGGEGPATSAAVGVSNPVVGSAFPAATSNIADNIAVGTVTTLVEIP